MFVRSHSVISSKSVQDALKSNRVDSGQNPEMAVSLFRTRKGVKIQPLITVLHPHHQGFSAFGPYADRPGRCRSVQDFAQDGVETQAVLIHAPHLDIGVLLLSQS